jgi:hypothetical protein
MTCALAHHLDRLVDQDPLQHGSSHSQWSCQELATVLARQTGVQLSRESVRTGCAFSGMQTLLAVAIVYVKRGRRRRRGEKNAGDTVAVCRMACA